MLRYLLVILLLLNYSCDKNSHIRKYTLSKPSQNIDVEKPLFTTENKKFLWSAPLNWIEGKKSSMRIGSYKIPFSGGYGDLSITNIQGDGGGLEANINRWRNQINLPPLTLEEISSEAIYGQSKIGPYKLFKIINEKEPSIAFLCSVISSEATTIFLKVNIIKDGIFEIEKDFIEFISTFEFAR